MPRYLLHMTAAGEPVGVFSENHDYYRPEYINLQPEGRELVLGKVPTTSWADFIEILADTRPGPTSRWDTYYHASSNLSAVLLAAQADTETIGLPPVE